MQSIKEVVRLVANNKNTNLWTYFGEFLDFFYSKDRTIEERFSSVKEEPEVYNNVDKETYAFIAGAIHKICTDYGVAVPEWVMHKKYFLEKPYFSMKAKGNLRLILLAESPIHFRMRHIFTTANTLKRV